MPTTDILIKLTTALNKIDELGREIEDNRKDYEKLHADSGKKIADTLEKIEKINLRLTTYDTLAAKWGGACMLAFFLGSLVWEFPEKFKLFFGIKP